MQPYEDYTKEFEEAFEKLKDITPLPNDVNDLQSEDDKLEFVKAFRNLMRLKNILASFADFTWDDLQMPEQEFEDFKSKYLDVYESTKREFLF
jgi:type I restriction enzyme R subunit